MTWPRVLLVADPAPTQLGAHLLDAAASLGVDIELCDTREAYRGSVIQRKMAWWLAGHRPARLDAFSASVAASARRHRADVVVTTGLAPVTREILDRIHASGVRVLNFLTDDPWNPAHRAPWFLKALAAYDIVFSPRRANLDDLRQAGVRRVEYLRFGYSPTAHRPERPAADLAATFEADVMLAGGADPERVRTVAPLLAAGVSVALYGGYWTRYPETRAHARGMLDEADLRHATAAARVCLGLVRRANRDGHSMRTFEVPAMRGCLLPERTDDHVDLFGDESNGACYFSGPGDVVAAVRRLLDDAGARQRLAARTQDVVLHGHHTYADRLAAMLEAA